MDVFIHLRIYGNNLKTSYLTKYVGMVSVRPEITKHYNWTDIIDDYDLTIEGTQ